MINFTVGPVQSSEAVLEIGKESTPYFRTPEFSQVMLDNERLMKKFTGADENARVVFITGSGTASMEASVINTLTPEDRALVVVGGGFGDRFAEICEIHDIPHDCISLNPGQTLTSEILNQYDGNQYTAFIVNMHETSTGVLYDMNLIGDYCKKHNLFLIVDAISAFIADPFNMEGIGADIMITGSQKALAVPPGISIIVLGPRALERVETTDCKCMYLNLKSALINGERGQTPFTPAVTTLLQINRRLHAIDEIGLDQEREKMKKLATGFRDMIKDLPFGFLSESPSNAVTTLTVSNNSAKDIFSILKDEYGIWICPNGGDLAEKVFRVGHLGNLTIEDYKTLVDALKELQERGVF